ncbi:hypothetical protein Aduo_009534 [Ancylostoma duodenale]
MWTRSRIEDNYLYMKVSLPLKSEKDITNYLSLHPFVGERAHRLGDRYIFRREDSEEEMYVMYKDGFMLINHEEKPS